MRFYADLFRKGRAAFRRDRKLVLCAALTVWLPSLIFTVPGRTGAWTRQAASAWLSLLPAVISALLTPGITIIWLKLLRQERAELRDLLTGLRFAGKYLLAGLLLGLMLFGVFLVLLILLLANGIWDGQTVSVMETGAALLMLIPLGCLYGLVGQTAVDMDTKGPAAVLRCSRELLRGRRLRFLGLMLIISVPAVPGVLLNGSGHPAAACIDTLLGALAFMLNSMLTSAFYETVRPAEKSDRGLRNRMRKERRKAARNASPKP